MKFVIAMFDTMRPDHLGCYGNTVVKTPNLDRFAETATVFERAYAASWPTIPNRTDLFTGRFGEPFHAWMPLAWDATTLPELMRQAGYVTQLIHDTPHLINFGFGFDRPFHAWWMIRGNEVDRFRTDFGELTLGFHPNKMMPAWRDGFHAQYLRNTRHRTREEEHSAPQVMTAAMDWLAQNYKYEKFFLWIDSFDPHEPWDPPQHYVDMYDPGYSGDVVMHFFNVPAITDRELQHIRACYAGKVTMVDRWFGRLLDRIDDLGIADETAIIVISDHGTGLGDHGSISKNVPIYEEIGRIVWMMRIPGLTSAGERVPTLIQPPDLMPTILEIAGIACPKEVQGSSLVPVLHKERTSIRDFVVTGWSPLHGRLYPITVVEDQWSLIHPPERDKWELYDLSRDPRQKNNVIRGNEKQAEKMSETLIQFLSWTGAPEWVVRAYRGESVEVPPLTPAGRAIVQRGLNPENFLKYPFQS